MDEYRKIFSRLQVLKDPLAILNDSISHYMISVLYNKTRSSFEIVNMSLEYDFAAIISNLIEESYKQFEAYLLSSPETRNGSTEDTKRVTVNHICAMSVGIVRSYTNYSIKFIKKAYEANLIKYLFKFLKNPILIDEYARHQTLDELGPFVVYSVSGALVNMSRVSTSFSDKWKSENAVEVLLEVSERLKENYSCQLDLNIVLANIADEEEIKKFSGNFNPFY